MTDWSKHVHRFAKKHNMSYKQANRSRKCKETYKKRKTSPRRKRRTSPRRKKRMNKPVNFDPERFILIPHEKGSYESQFSYDDLSDSQKKVFVELMDPFSGSIPYPREFAIDMAKTFSSSEIKKAKRIQKGEEDEYNWAYKQMNEGVPSYVATTNFEIDNTKETYFARQMNENGYESLDPMSVLEFGRNYKSTWKQSAGKWFSDLGSVSRTSMGGRDTGGRDMGGRDMGGRDMGGRDTGR